MSGVTIKDLLETKYSDLKNELLDIIDADLFPVIEENTNWVEFVNFVFFLFPSDAVKFHLEELLEFKDIVLVNDKVDILVPIITKYLDWLKKVKKHF